MKKLKVPNLPTLDVLDLSSVGYIMENKGCREYINMANWPSYPYKPIAVFDIARTDINLYIRFFVKGNSLKALYASDGSPVYTDSCVEFFVKKVEDKEYINFEFNCIGTCDAAFRESRDIKRPFTAEQYQCIRRLSTVEKSTFEEKKGIYSWELVVAVPLSLIGLTPDHLPEKILGNFYKCADDTENPHYLSWNRIGTDNPDFHRPEYFGEIYF